MSFTDDEEDILNRIASCFTAGTSSYNVPNFSVNTLSFDGIRIDNNRRIVIRGSREIELTFIEFEILLLLAQNAGTVFRKEQIYDLVWKEPYSGDYNIVMSHIHNIREKIEDNPSKPVYIQTVWGVGYRFNKNLSSGL